MPRASQIRRAKLARRADQYDQRTKLLAANHKVYYLTDHYVNHPTVLVRLGVTARRSLKDLLEMAWRFASFGRKSSRQKSTSTK